MGGPVGATLDSQPEAKFKSIPNNTHKLWWCDPGLRKNMLHCIGLCGTLFCNGYDGSLFNGLQSIDAWLEYFDHPTSNILGLMNCAGFLPGLFVFWIADWFGFYYGRRYTVWIGSVFAICGALVISFATSRGMFIAGRAVLGIGVQGTLVMSPCLLQEIAHPRHRAKIGSLYMTIYYMAAVISACVCRGTISLSGNKAWRIPCFLQVIGPAEDDPLVEFEYRETLEALSHEEADVPIRYTDYLKGSGNRRRLLIVAAVSLGTNWVGNGIIGYYSPPTLSSLGITSTDKQLDMQIGLQVWNFVLASAAPLAVDRAGRRPLWLVSTVGMLISYCIVMALSASYDKDGNKATGTAVIPFFFIFYGFYDIAWTPLSYSYPVEILTFSLRTKGQAIFVFMQTLGMSLNLWVNPVALDAIGWKYYSVYVAVLAGLVVLIYFTFPETKNLTIEEIAIVFDGDRAMRIVEASHGEQGIKDSDEKDFGDAEHIAVSD